MPLTKFTGATNTIQSLSDRPNQTDGLTAAQLKLKFDQIAIDTEAYFNDVLTVEADSTFATKAELQDIILDQVPDGSITPAKLSFTPATSVDITDLSNSLNTNVIAIYNKILNDNRVITMGGIV